MYELRLNTDVVEITSDRKGDNSEIVDHLLYSDMSPHSKWFLYNSKGEAVTMKLKRPMVIAAVGIRSANDAHDRNPSKFTVAVSGPETTLTEVLSVNDKHLFEGPWHKKTFMLPQPMSIDTLIWKFEDNCGSGDF